MPAAEILSPQAADYRSPDTPAISSPTGNPNAVTLPTAACTLCEHDGATLGRLPLYRHADAARLRLNLTQPLRS
jgi:hypothetical protein